VDFDTILSVVVGSSDFEERKIVSRTFLKIKFTVSKEISPHLIPIAKFTTSLMNVIFKLKPTFFSCKL
jgi:hypothetical protein